MHEWKKPNRRLVSSLFVGWVLIVGAMTLESAGPVKSALVPEKMSGASIPGLIQYKTPTGEHFATIVLPAPPQPVVKKASHDHVLIVDTSASQAGAYRSRSQGVAASYCAALPADDRVLLIASDVLADSLTTGFVAPNSPELKVGFQSLNERIPLGCSSLELALRTALTNFKGAAGGSITYIGDGYSTAQLIQVPAVRKLVDDLRQAAIPVNSFAVGPRTDLLLLGALAQHTGGCLTIDEPLVATGTGPLSTKAAIASDAKRGQELARVAKSPVFYPSHVTTTPKIHGLKSDLLPPVRFDRETVLLGQGLTGDKISVQMKGQMSGQPHEFEWNIRAEKLTGSTGYVYQAWKLSEETRGIAMPLAGRSLILKNHEAYQSQLDALMESGLDALRRKSPQQAELIAQSLQQLDPSNPEARQILIAANKLRVKPIKYQRIKLVAQAEQEEKPATEEVPAAEDTPAVEPIPTVEESPAVEAPITSDAKPEAAEMEAEGTLEGEAKVEPPTAPDTNPIDAGDRSNPKATSLLEELTERQQVRIQELTAEVNRTVGDAQELAKTDFVGATAQLKDVMNDVESALEVPDAVRLPLRRKLDSALQKIQNENETFVQKAAALRTKQSQLESRKKLMDQAERDEERMQQLIERVRALITRGAKGEAEAFEEAEEYSRLAVELDPYNYVPNLDVFVSESFGALDKARRMRALRADKFLAELYEVERAHVPFPDEPPILWPSAERWREITIKREKWKSVDLKNYSKQEEKIVSALGKPMKEKFDFVDATLEDVRNKLMEVYDINVVIDKVKLEEDSITTDTADITLAIDDITLKNALKLLLEPKGLTYFIQDEVLKISTKSDGGVKKPIKAYYAGDLATPINAYAGMGGQAGGSMGGGQGGMGGGMGGMQGGMGGGMGGMQGGMGGGGMGGGVF